MVAFATCIIMKNIRIITPDENISSGKLSKLATFLFEHLEQYGDELSAIEKAIVYANSKQSPGGYIIELVEDEKLLSVAVINKTGMADYIPENILVYLATHKEHRGKGLGGQVMQKMIEVVRGDVALHVEPENPAKRLYEKFGFGNKYLEMRLIKK